MRLAYKICIGVLLDFVLARRITLVEKRFVSFGFGIEIINGFVSDAQEPFFGLPDFAFG